MNVGFAIAFAIWMVSILRVVRSRHVAGAQKVIWAVVVALCPLLLVAFVLCVEYWRPLLRRHIA